MPGFAKMFQNGTEPSAKSSHTGVRDGSVQLVANSFAGAPFPPVSASASATTTRSPRRGTLHKVSRSARKPLRPLTKTLLSGALTAVSKALTLGFGRPHRKRSSEHEHPPGPAVETALRRSGV